MGVTVTVMKLRDWQQTVSTEKELKNALIRLKHGRPKIVDKKRKLSISALAEEAGVSDSTIHTPPVS
jgi:hypothetical protein